MENKDKVIEAACWYPVDEVRMITSWLKIIIVSRKKAEH
jgi:hypothetical protein